jgi:carbamoyltransferase
MDVWIGLGGAARDGCAAVCTGEEVLGVCRQERVTRVRGAGFNPTGFPDEALDELLHGCGRTRKDVVQYGLAEPANSHERNPDSRCFDHHFAHACTAFLTSPFDAATVVVCDDEPPEISVWDGRGTEVTRINWPWHGPGLARFYSECARLLDFVPGAEERRMEALARLEATTAGDEFAPVVGFAPDRLLLAPDWRSRVRERIGNRCRQPGSPASSIAAAALQARTGDILVELLQEVRRRAAVTGALCLGGSLFQNSYFNSRVKCSQTFSDVFVPIDPGNSGLAVGTGLCVSGQARRPVTPFLGPGYDVEQVKATLNNCKLKYTWMSESDAVAAAVKALVRGRLVGWFDGRMEWGPRALGGRSIVASPFAPYVLENLNRFLKHRDPWRGYALSGPEEAVREHFHGPIRSRFMECDYTPKDPELFQYALPGPNAAVRMQTFDEVTPSRFAHLTRAFGDVAGAPFLVNTSFNGFREPIVCSPRDAIRVFYGTGIDMLVLGSFVLTKE